MSGWRGQFGAVVPAINTVAETEFSRHLPRGVALHASRTRSRFGSRTEKMAGMREDLARCGDLLATAGVDVVAFCATKASLWGGVGYAERIERELSEAAGGVPAIATAASVTRACDSLDLGSIAVHTPYDADANRRVAEYLEGVGFDVVDVQGSDDSVSGLGELSPERTYRRVRGLAHEDADGVFVSCTAHRTLGIVDRLERDIGKPVITSNQATLWDGLRTLGVDDAGVELGTLFTDTP